MKRTIATISVGIVLLFGLDVIVSGERVVTDNNAPEEVEHKTQLNTAAGADEDIDRPQQVTVGIDDHEIPWESINAGGNDMQSPAYVILSSVGQSVIGFGANANYQTGIGYWYGAHIEGGVWCNCGVWGDVTGDGAINPIDVVYMVNRVYLSNDMTVQHPNCPRDAGDVNCDGAVNPVDVVFFVNRVYLGNDMFCADPCS